MVMRTLCSQASLTQTKHRCVMQKLSAQAGWTLAIVAGALAVPVEACSEQTAGRQLDTSVPLTYYIAEALPEAGAREGDRTLARWALEAWARQTNSSIAIEPGPEETATIRVYWVPAGTGLYGEMRSRVTDGRRAADEFVHPDTDGLGRDIALEARTDPLFRDAIVYLTCVHEIGHAFGLSHTSDFDDIMYSFQYGGDFVAYFKRFRDQLGMREDIRRVSPFSEGDSATFRALYPSD